MARIDTQTTVELPEAFRWGGTQYQWHATYCIEGETIVVLTRDAKRSVSDAWRVVARTAVLSGGLKVAEFIADNLESQLIAANLADMGISCYGVSLKGWDVVAYSPRINGYAPSLTVPATIRKAISGGAGDRRRSLDLGIPAKGEGIAKGLNVQSMRERILAMEAARKAKKGGK